MRLNFMKVGNLLCPTDENGELVEDVAKCTVTSDAVKEGKNETVMTLTVKVVSRQESPTLTTWVCTECEMRGGPDCTHVGSKPRICRKQTSVQPVWRDRDAT